MVDGITPFQLVMFVVSWIVGFVVSRMSDASKANAKKVIPLLTLILAGITQAVQLFAQAMGTPATAPAMQAALFQPLFIVQAPAWMSYAAMTVVPAGLFSHVGGVFHFLLDTIAQWWLVTGGHSTTKNLKQLVVS